MFRYIDRYLQHRAAMDIMRLAVDLTSDAIFRADERDIAAHIAKVSTTAEALATAHIKVCTKLKGITTIEMTDKEVKVLGTIFSNKSP